MSKTIVSNKIATIIGELSTELRKDFGRDFSFTITVKGTRVASCFRGNYYNSSISMVRSKDGHILPQRFVEDLCVVCGEEPVEPTKDYDTCYNCLKRMKIEL